MSFSQLQSHRIIVHMAVFSTKRLRFYIAKRNCACAETERPMAEMQKQETRPHVEIHTELSDERGMEAIDNLPVMDPAGLPPL